MGWLKNQMVALSLAMSSVEKNALTQTKNQLSDTAGVVQKHMQGNLMDSLINGEVTEEVKLLRARLYKVSEAMDSMVISMSYDDNGDPIYGYESKDYKTQLDNLTLDTHDSYPPELVFYNKTETATAAEAIQQFLSHATQTDNPKYNPDIPEHETTNPKTITVGRVSDVEEKPLIITREFTTRFLIEQHITKVVSRKIDSKMRLVELYISKYPNAERPNSKMFLKYFKREMVRPEKSDLFEIKGLEFITNNASVGITHGILFEMNEAEFDKIIEHDGNYVVKFKMRITNVEDIKDYFRHEELDELYENNAPRKRR